MGSGWSQPYTAPFTPDLYPRMHLLPNGKVFYSGAPPVSEFFDPSSTDLDAECGDHELRRHAGVRKFGSAGPDAGQQL